LTPQGKQGVIVLAETAEKGIILLFYNAFRFVGKKKLLLLGE